MPKTTTKTSTLNVSEHLLVPKHEIVSDKEKKQLMEHYAAKPEDFPKIFITDAAISHLSIKEGDIIKISRSSATAGEATFYRIVVSE